MAPSTWAWTTGTGMPEMASEKSEQVHPRLLHSPTDQDDMGQSPYLNPNALPSRMMDLNWVLFPQLLPWAPKTPSTVPAPSPRRFSAPLPRSPASPNRTPTREEILAPDYSLKGPLVEPTVYGPSVSGHQRAVSEPAALPSMAQILAALAELGDRVMRGEEFVLPDALDEDVMARDAADEGNGPAIAGDNDDMLPDASDEDAVWHDAVSSFSRPVYGETEGSGSCNNEAQ